MEDNSNPGPFRTVRRFWCFAIGLLLLGMVTARAQTNTIINLCNEETLRTYVSLGGVYQMGNCGTNASILSIQLTQPLLVEKDFTLISTQELLLDAQSLSRLFVVKPGVRLTLQKVLLFAGRQTETNRNDGGIPDTAGAAIYNDGGIVTLIDGRVQANSVLGVTGLAAEDGTGRDGEPGGDAAGGAIYNNGGQLIISNTVFSLNSVTGGIGGKGGSSRSGFGGEAGRGGDGGSGAGAAIFSRGGQVSVYSSTFSTNSATGAVAGEAGVTAGVLGLPGAPGETGDGVGAAIFGENAEINVTSSTFLANTARTTNGLAGVAGLRNQTGGSGLKGGDAAGGAIYSTGPLRVTNSTFYGNAALSGSGGAGGAGGGSGFGGDGGDGGNGGNATGGAIESVGEAFIVHCTFADNVTTAGSGGAGGAGSGVGETGDNGDAGLASGGAVYASGAEVRVANSILANSTVTLGGNIKDEGGNLSTDLNPLLSRFNLRLTNPLLRPLSTNGGPTLTLAIATNSPAVDAGASEFCLDVDQRGTNRTGRCDIGAFEIAGAAPAPAPVPTNVLNGLTISQSTNLVMLQWPAGYTNLFLQFSTNLLTTNTPWAIAPQIPSTNAGSNIVTVNTTNAARRRTFFRLVELTDPAAANAARTNSGPPTPN
jgi:hypothetical protein